MKNKNKSGAGRPPRPYPREALTIRVEPEVADAFRSLCDKHGFSQSKMMTKLVDLTDKSK